MLAFARRVLQRERLAMQPKKWECGTSHACSRARREFAVRKANFVLS